MSGSWQSIALPPAVPSGTFNAETMLLLTDGSLLVHNAYQAEWLRFTPDPVQGYAGGTWSTTPTIMNNDRMFFASGVLNDGRVYAIGGELSNSAGGDTALGEIWDPATNPPAWTAMTATDKPAAFNFIQGDASSCMLADGRVLFGAIVSQQTAAWDPASSSWVQTGTAFGTIADTKNGNCNEETWTLLPDGSVLTVNTKAPAAGPFNASPTSAERYLPSEDIWIATGATQVSLPVTTVFDSQTSTTLQVYEIGPAILLNDGTVIAFGASGHTAIFTPDPDPTKAGSWVKGKDFPADPGDPSNGNFVLSANGLLTQSDSPAVMQPNGRVLTVAGTLYKNKNNAFSKNSQYFEYDPVAKTLTPLASQPPSAATSQDTWTARFLLLPTGEIMLSTQQSQVYLYKPDPSEGTYKAAWQPTIKTFANALIIGHSRLLTGTGLNGRSQANSYGDDAQMATNYPIVQITDTVNNNVYYLRTQDFSSRGVAVAGDQTCSVTVPIGTPPGAYNLVVIANGIPSAAQAVTIAAQLPQIVVDLQDGLDFATVCGGGRAYRTLTVFNVGNADLIVDAVSNIAGSGDFTVLPNPTTPLTIESGDEVDFTIEFTPTTTAFETATIRITSNDPVTPNLDVVATGTGGIAAIETVIPDTGSFGNVCLGSFVDELLTINNSGTCPLLIFDITGSANFLPPSVLSYPLLVDSGDSIDVVVRFQPSTHGTQPGTITIFSNDPASPHVVAVSGAAPAPKANLIIANTGDFGEVRLGKFTDRDLVINNRGPCPLSVTGLVSSAPVVFVTPEVVSFPLTVDGGDSIAVPIRFQPTNRGSATATLTIISNDPSSPAVVNVSGTAWPPLPIAGSPIEGYRLSNDSQHVNYIGTDKHVHELYITAGAGWVDNDLTEEAGAVPPTATSALEGYRLSDDSQHVFFIGTDNHVYELYITAGAGWVYNDLTALARAVPPNPTSALDGYRLSDDSKHVNFIGTDNHVHELYIARGGRWVDNDLTTLAGAVPPTPTSALDGHRLSDDSQHVNFIGTDNHVHELYIHTGAGWVDNDLTTQAGAMPPTPTSALDGYRLSDDSQHVFFIGTDNHVHELYITAGAGWVDNDLTTLAGAVPPIPTTALDGYRLSNDSKHVNFIGTDNHVHELYITAGAGWVDDDLTALT